MNQSYVKKMSRLLSENGIILGDNDHEIAFALEYRVNEVREKAVEKDLDELEFSIDFEIDSKKFVFLGGISKESEQVGDEEIDNYPAYYEYIQVGDKLLEFNYQS